MVGIDVLIEAQRLIFEDNLFVGSTYVSYHRAFVNEKTGVNIPEIHVSDSNEYTEVLLNDKIDGHSFFVVRPNISVLDGALLTANVDIYFALNLDKLYPSATQRAVEYAHRDILALLTRTRFMLKEIVTGLQAFDDFGFIDLKDNMEPFYLVKFETEIEYQYNEC